jgi:hypothetical protein
MWQHAQGGTHDSRFPQPLFVYVNPSGWRVGNRVQHDRDFWRAFEDTPDAVLYASGPASEDANGERHAGHSNRGPLTFASLGREVCRCPKRSSEASVLRMGICRLEVGKVFQKTVLRANSVYGRDIPQE